MKTELQRARAFTDSLFGLVSRETLYETPDPRSTSPDLLRGTFGRFRLDQLARGVLGKPSFDASFDTLFEAASILLPANAAGHTLRLAARKPYKAMLARNGAIDDIWTSSADRQQMVLEHRWMHAETICYLLHQLDPALKRQAFSATPAVSGNGVPPTYFIAIEAGRTQRGQPNGEFGWDNEFPAHVQPVPAFEISKHKVTNGECLRFVEQGGAPPLFWRLTDGAWRLRRMFDEVPLPLDTRGTRRTKRRAVRSGQELLTHRREGHASLRASQAYPWGNTDPMVCTATRFVLGSCTVCPNRRRQPLGGSQMIGNGGRGRERQGFKDRSKFVYPAIRNFFV